MLSRLYKITIYIENSNVSNYKYQKILLYRKIKLGRNSDLLIRSHIRERYSFRLQGLSEYRIQILAI